MPSLVYFVSGHGFGHAVRSAEVMRALQRRAPRLEIHLRTTAPAWLFPPLVSVAASQLDVGVVQPDALHVDPVATLRRMAALVADADSLVQTEVRFLQQVRAGLIVADVPPLPFLAARQLDVASVAVANFSWDWIYQPYAAAAPNDAWVIDWIREAYGQAGLLLRLPMHGDLGAFQRIEDVPLICRQPSAPREVVRRRLGLAPHETVVLLGFGGLGLAGLDARPLGKLPEYTFLTAENDVADAPDLPPNVRRVTVRQQNYDDLIVASDVVVSKPGFGTVASCLVHHVPLLYADRGEFSEYPILVAALHRLGRARHIPRQQLLAADLGPHLAALLADRSPWSALRADGAEVIAARLLELIGPHQAGK